MVGGLVGGLVGFVGGLGEGCEGGGCSHIHRYQIISFKKRKKSVFGPSDGPPCPCVRTARLPTVGDRWLRLPRPRSRQRWHGALGGFQGADEKSSWVFPRGEDKVRAKNGLGFLQITEEGHLAGAKKPRKPQNATFTSSTHVCMHLEYMMSMYERLCLYVLFHVYMYVCMLT